MHPESDYGEERFEDLIEKGRENYLPLSAGKTGDKTVEAWKECKGQKREVRLARYKVLKGSEKERMVGALVNGLLRQLKRTFS